MIRSNDPTIAPVIVRQRRPPTLKIPFGKTVNDPTESTDLKKRFIKMDKNSLTVQAPKH